MNKISRYIAYCLGFITLSSPCIMLKHNSEKEIRAFEAALNKEGVGEIINLCKQRGPLSFDEYGIKDDCIRTAAIQLRDGIKGKDILRSLKAEMQPENQSPIQTYHLNLRSGSYTNYKTKQPQYAPGSFRSINPFSLRDFSGLGKHY